MFQRALSPLPGSGGNSNKIKVSAEDVYELGVWCGAGMTNSGFYNFGDTGYTPIFDVSSVSSVKFYYYFNAADSSNRGQIGYKLDDTETVITPTTTSTFMTLDLTNTDEFCFFGKANHSGNFGNNMVLIAKFS